jgi:hypothetical protein
MNIWKLVSVAAIGSSTLLLGYHAAHAQGAAAWCNNQHNMMRAIELLRRARGSLERAEHDKGGWRVRAIESTDAAIKETENGCAFADTH